MADAMVAVGMSTEKSGRKVPLTPRGLVHGRSGHGEMLRGVNGRAPATVSAAGVTPSAWPHPWPCSPLRWRSSRRGA